MAQASVILLVDSNTTYVNVKSCYSLAIISKVFNSNTTYVNVKLSSVAVCGY